MNDTKYLIAGVAVTVVLLIILIFIFCSETTTDTDGIAKPSRFGLIKISDICGTNQLYYDPATKVIYMYVHEYQTGGITPYYVIGEDGKPEIAVYGVNYK